MENTPKMITMREILINVFLPIGNVEIKYLEREYFIR